jgi:hypothetical protein
MEGDERKEKEEALSITKEKVQVHSFLYNTGYE